MLGTLRVIVIAVFVLGAFFYFSHIKMQPPHPKPVVTALKQSAVIAFPTNARRAPARALKINEGVTVTRAAGEGRESIRIASVQDLDELVNHHEELLNRFRLDPMPPIPGAEPFEMLKLKAVPRDQYNSSMGEFISDKLGFVIFASHTQRDFGLMVDGAHPVLAKKSNGMLGIVTGTIIVTLKELTAAEALARQYDLTLKYLDKDLKLAYFAAPAQAALDSIVRALGENASVEHVDLEVVNSRKRL